VKKLYDASFGVWDCHYDSHIENIKWCTFHCCPVKKRKKCACKLCIIQCGSCRFVGHKHKLFGGLNLSDGEADCSSPWTCGTGVYNALSYSVSIFTAWFLCPWGNFSIPLHLYGGRVLILKLENVPFRDGCGPTKHGISPYLDGKFYLTLRARIDVLYLRLRHVYSVLFLYVRVVCVLFTLNLQTGCMISLIREQ
jgi:hypothetical protein